MKKLKFAGLLLFITGFAIAQTDKKQVANCETGITINNNYSKAAARDSIMKYYTANALPGVAMAVSSEKDGWWAGAQGYANAEKKIPMENCHLQYLQSVSKTYMAVAILQLKEQGKIDLDAPVTKYLPEKYSRYIKDAGKITVRMLLNHVSGIPEYNSNPSFVSAVIQHPLENFSAIDCLKSIANMAFFIPLGQSPSTRMRYSSVASDGQYIRLICIVDIYLFYD
ncbi:MAG: serine hydrolase domain-containing protein, partial [Chitinophagaceae bacterium]